MKPAPFDYAAPQSVADAVALLAAHPGDALPIAGGQSLMPVLAFRLRAPKMLVDLRRIPGLDRIEIGADGVRLGARVRWCDIERDARLHAAHPLLLAAIAHVAHYPIRNRGTVGGSLAHADPAAELPGIAVACDATIEITGPGGARIAHAGSFFVGPLSTALAPGELITALHLPAWPRKRRHAFEEFARRRGDFAMAGIATWFDLDGAGRATNTHVAVIGACAKPHRLGAAEAAVDGHAVDAATIARAAEAARGEVDPPSDIHASARYRRALAGTLVERALARAATMEMPA